MTGRRGGEARDRTCGRRVPERVDRATAIGWDPARCPSTTPSAARSARTRSSGLGGDPSAQPRPAPPSEPADGLVRGGGRRPAAEPVIGCRATEVPIAPPQPPRPQPQPRVVLDPGADPGGAAGRSGRANGFGGLGLPVLAARRRGRRRRRAGDRRHLDRRRHGGHDRRRPRRGSRTRQDEITPTPGSRRSRRRRPGIDGPLDDPAREPRRRDQGAASSRRATSAPSRSGPIASTPSWSPGATTRRTSCSRTTGELREGDPVDVGIPQDTIDWDRIDPGRPRPVREGGSAKRFDLNPRASTT